MNYTLFAIFAFSISIPALIGWIRFVKISPTYYPFLFCIWIGLLNEILGYIITHKGYSNAVNNNIYVLIESILITWQFKKWELFERAKWLFLVLLSSYFIFWGIE